MRRHRREGAADCGVVAPLQIPTFPIRENDHGHALRGTNGFAAHVSAKKRTPETLLECRHRAGPVAEHGVQMRDGLEQRIGVLTGWRRPLAAQACPHRIEPAAQSSHDPMKRLQRKGSAQTLGRRFDRRPGQQHSEQAREQRGAHAVSRQHLREEHRERAPAAAAPAAVRAERALAARSLPVGMLRIVAPQTAVAVQRAAPAAVGAALPLERKSTTSRAARSATKRMQFADMACLRARTTSHPPSLFFTAPAAGLGSRPVHQMEKPRH